MTVAALGGAANVEALTDPELVEVAAGTQSGQIYRVRGHGAVRKVVEGAATDLLARARVLTPVGLDDEQVRILRALASERGEVVENRGVFAKLKRAIGLDD